MKCDHNQHDVKQFAYGSKCLGKVLGLSDEQLLKHCKEAFPLKIEAYLLEINNIHVAIWKVIVLISLFKSELPQSTSSSLLVHMTDRNEEVKYTGHASRIKPKHIS